MAKGWNSNCNCGAFKTHNMRYDSFYCSVCDIWVEEVCKCQLGTCEFLGRPEKPSLLTDEDKKYD